MLLGHCASKVGLIRIFMVKGTSYYISTCLRIAESLPEWFGDEELKSMSSDLRDSDILVGVTERDNEVAGFLSFRSRFEDVIEVRWMGVRRDLMRKGIGTCLIKSLENLAQRLGRKAIVIKTYCKPNSEAQKITRKFLRTQNYILIDTIESNKPINIYVKIIK